MYNEIATFKFGSWFDYRTFQGVLQRGHAVIQSYYKDGVDVVHAADNKQRDKTMDAMEINTNP